MRLVSLLTLILLAGAAGSAAGDTSPSRDLPRSTPEAQGVSSAAALDFVEAADRSVDSLHSLMIVRHGRVVAEGWWHPYGPEDRHQLYSLSKSFTATAVGLAAAEGKLSLDDPIVSFFPGDAPAQPGPNLKAMRIRDLLRMSTGHQSEPPRKPDEPWVKTFLHHPVPFKPGTHFLYNTSATYMLSAAVQKATGQTVLEYLKPRLFDPLGIEHPTWETSPQGVSTGGYGLSVRTEDIAKFGQLYLQKGRWNGKQLVPEAWVEAATARQTSNGSDPTRDWDQGYGYQFWRCRHGAYRGDGAFGQFCVVLPEQDTVIAITAGLRDMQAVLNLVWDKLLPGLKPAPLAADDETRVKLGQTLKHLSLRAPKPADAAGAGLMKQVHGRKYAFPANPRKLDELILEPGSGAPDRAARLVLTIDGVAHRLDCGAGTFARNSEAPVRFDGRPVAVAGAWTGADTFTAKLCFYETPFVATLRLTFAGDEVRWEWESNVWFGPTKEPPLTGKAPK